MTRPHHRLHVPTAVAPAQNAVSLIWGREQSGQLQVLMTQRSSLARFAPGAYVFAGGKIDEADQDYAKSYLLHSQAKPAQRQDAGHASTSPYHVRPEQTLEHLTQAAAALRESGGSPLGQRRSGQQGEWQPSVGAPRLAATPVALPATARTRLALGARRSLRHVSLGDRSRFAHSL